MAHGPVLADVEELCRLVVVARRLGCRVRIDDVGPELGALIELVGVADVISPPGEADRSS